MSQKAYLTGGQVVSSGGRGQLTEKLMGAAATAGPGVRESADEAVAADMWRLPALADACNV